ncbi:MAG: FecR family protein, partial [Rhodothermales bacterium]|nr:FecR family protein [Rhodothermales bacterium]
MIRRIALLVALLVPLAPQAQPAADDVNAVLLRVVREVDRSEPGPDAEWTEAATLDELLAGYRVRTGVNSLTLVQFADDTKLVVRERSLLVLRGQMQNGRIAEREVEVTEGNIAFTVEKRPEEEFRFTSPTSVASIRGTLGGFAVTDDGTTYLVITEDGPADFSNTISGQSVIVNAGQTGISRPDGTIEVRDSTADDLLFADDGLPEGRSRILVVPGQDEDGNPRT